MFALYFPSLHFIASELNSSSLVYFFGEKTLYENFLYLFPRETAGLVKTLLVASGAFKSLVSINIILLTFVVDEINLDLNLFWGVLFISFCTTVFGYLIEGFFCLRNLTCSSLFFLLKCKKLVSRFELLE
jgi:hypothetical protein